MVELRSMAVLGAVTTIGAVGLLAPVSAQADPPGSAVVQFGVPGIGADKPREHPTHNANDRMQPGTVAVAKGGSVTFDVEGFHQVAVYEPGTGPQDIPRTPDPAVPLFVDHEPGRVALGAPLQDLTVQFTEPGRYLVICNVRPHFQEFSMYGWVVVQ